MGFYVAQPGFKLCVQQRVALISHCYFKIILHRTRGAPNLKQGKNSMGM